MKNQVQVLYLFFFHLSSKKRDSHVFVKSTPINNPSCLSILAIMVVPERCMPTMMMGGRFVIICTTHSRFIDFGTMFYLLDFKQCFS